MDHMLQANGAAYDAEKRIRINNSTSGAGVALCTCGAASPVVPNRNARKAWFSEHKAAAEVAEDLARLEAELAKEADPSTPMTKANAFALIKRARMALRGGDLAIKQNRATPLRTIAEEMFEASKELLAALNGPGIAGLK